MVQPRPEAAPASYRTGVSTGCGEALAPKGTALVPIANKGLTGCDFRVASSSSERNNPATFLF
jgi:hypothetical protein